MKKIAAGVAALIVIFPLALFMPWSEADTKSAALQTIAEIHTAEADKPSPSPPPSDSPAPTETPSAEATVPEITPYEPDAAEVEALARMLYGEARGVASDMEKAACVWCVMNRVDDPRFPDTALEVLEAPYQFSGYSVNIRFLTT